MIRQNTSIDTAKTKAEKKITASASYLYPHPQYRIEGGDKEKWRIFGK